MRRKEFTDLLQRYLDNNCSDSEKRLVDYWYSLLETDAGRTPEKVDFTEIEDRLWHRIKPIPTPEEPFYQKPKHIWLSRRTYQWIGLAASILLLFLVGWLAYPGWKKATPQEAIEQRRRDWTERANTTTEPLRLLLADGSLVVLEPDSRLLYPKSFSKDKREVRLVGKAFFQVKRMPSKPFYVNAGSVVTKVLGTSFHVRMHKKAQAVQVEVVTGRVSVYEKSTAGKAGEMNGVILNPNYKATFYNENQHFITGLADAPQLVDSAAKPASTRFVYDDTPVGEIVQELESAYGIDIVLEDEQVNSCPITADISQKPLYTQLDIICAALRTTYSIQGTSILISGKGCQ